MLPRGMRPVENLQAGRLSRSEDYLSRLPLAGVRRRSHILQARGPAGAAPPDAFFRDPGETCRELVQHRATRATGVA